MKDFIDKHVDELHQNREKRKSDNKMKLNLSELNKISAEFDRGIIASFKDIPVRVDESLRGYEYYISVSPELCEKLKKAKNVGAGN